MKSRLEARWAAFFDNLGWPWEYEPIDLKGYVPDFVLMLEKPLLVEVKPLFSLERSPMLVMTQDKIDESGWEGEALIALATLLDGSWGPLLGSLREGPGGIDGEWNECSAFHCLSCGRPSLHSAVGSFRCRVCSAYDGDSHVLSDDGSIVDMWIDAGNRVQWRRGLQ